MRKQSLNNYYFHSSTTKQEIPKWTSCFSYVWVGAFRRLSGGHPLCDDRSGTERHHRPLGHANGKWMGQDSNLRCFFVTDLQSAALATRHTHPWGDQGESVSAPLRSAQSRCPPDILRPHKQSHNLPDYHCPIATVAPAGLEPIISGLRGRCPDL